MCQSIDYTKVPLPPRLPVKSSEEPQDAIYDYVTREVKPATLLLQDLIRAHTTFLLHHDTSLSALYLRLERERFVAALSRYWDLFLATWSVTLHGNPIRNVFGGTNMAASGELGIGVGEEERGSGVREVLEGLVARTGELIDLVVSKFGNEHDEEDAVVLYNDKSKSHWLGTGQEPASGDGAIFLGVGKLSRRTIRDVTQWMEDIYQWGDHAYGVIDNPSSMRAVRARRPNTSVDETTHDVQGHDSSAPKSPEQPTEAVSAEDHQATASAEEGTLDKVFSFMKLGYGSYWNIPGGNSSGTNVGPLAAAASPPSPEHFRPPPARPRLSQRVSSNSRAHFLIGLQGSLDDPDDEYIDSDDSSGSSTMTERNALRTLRVELEDKPLAGPEDTVVRDYGQPDSTHVESQFMGNLVPGFHAQDFNKAEKIRVIVYVNRPFFFTFIFQLRSDCLMWESFYRSLHHQLAPLKKPLLAATSYRPRPPAEPIYNLVWDPSLLAVHSSIPNIPEESASDTWSRLDALNTHQQLLNLHHATRRMPASKTQDLERTEKTNRGYWIVWNRLSDKFSSIPPSEPLAVPELARREQGQEGEEGQEEEEKVCDATNKEVYLVRRASDHAGHGGISVGKDKSSAGAASRLMQGIGLDTRSYVEELLTLL